MQRRARHLLPTLTLIRFALQIIETTHLIAHNRLCAGLLNDLYVLDPVAMAWTNLSDAASGTPPPARYLHGFASAGGKLYVHGGIDAHYNCLSDLYAFDPVAVAWTDLTDGAYGLPPRARNSHGFTSAGGKVYVHGGEHCEWNNESIILDDLHMFDPVAKAWTDLSAPAGGTAPTARNGHGFTSANGTLYVHGGQDEYGNLLSDIHSYSPIAKVWTDLSKPVAGTAPTARYGHGFTSANGKLYVHGGGSFSHVFDDLHGFDPIAKVWTNLSKTPSASPTGRQLHGFESAGGKLYVHGGSDVDGGYLGDLHSFDPVAVAWTDLTAAVNGIAPSAREDHGFTLADGKLYVHAGSSLTADEGFVTLGDLHVFDPVNEVWTSLSAAASGIPPTARAFHGFTSAGGKLYVHGGADVNSNPLGDLHSFDPVAVAWKDLSVPTRGTVPTARSLHGFVSLNGTLYVQGGLDVNYSALSDLHSFDPVATLWTDLSASVNGIAPTARYGHGFTAADGKLYVHGGVDDSSIRVLSDLHSFDPVAKVWTDLSTPAGGTAPAARMNHGFTPADGKLYVHGGSSCYGPCNLGDLHVFDPVAKVWADLTDGATSPPTARQGHGFASAGQRLYVHGGQGVVGAAR